FIGDLVRLLGRVIAHRAIGSINAVTGQTHSFHVLAELCVRIAQSVSSIRYLPRGGPMPHNGFRAFDNGAVTAAFPDFRFTSIEDSLRQIQQNSDDGLKESAA
ncbi:MAG: hypothetical protein AB7H77_01830, partial [Bdellovibrionales bacterium]